MNRYFDFKKIDKSEEFNDSTSSSEDDNYPEFLQITDKTKIVFHNVNKEKIVEEIVNNDLTTDQKNYLVLCRYFDCLQIIYQYSQDYSSLNNQNIEFIFDMVKVESFKNKDSKDEFHIYYPYQNFNILQKLKEDRLPPIINSFIKVLSYFYFQLNVSFIIIESQQNFFSKLYRYHSKKLTNRKTYYFNVIPFFQNLDYITQTRDVDYKIVDFKNYINKLTNNYKAFSEKLCKNNIDISKSIENITRKSVEDFKPNCEINCKFVKAIRDLEGNQFNLPAINDSIYSQNNFIFSIFSNDTNILDRYHPNFDNIINFLELNYENKTFVSYVYCHLLYNDPKIIEFNIGVDREQFEKNLDSLAKKDVDDLKLLKLYEPIKDQIFKAIERRNSKNPKESEEINEIKKGKKGKNKKNRKNSKKHPDEIEIEKSDEIEQKQPDEIEQKRTDEIDTNQYDANIITINKEEILLIDKNLQKFYDAITEFKKLEAREDFFAFMENKKIDYKREISDFFTIYDNIDQLIYNRNEFNYVFEEISMINNLTNSEFSVADITNKYCISAIKNRSNFYLLFGKILKQLIKCNLNKPKYFDRKTIEKYFNINTIEKCFKISAYSTNNSESFLKLAHVYRQDLKAWKYSLYKNDYKIDPKKYRYYLDASAYFNNSKANLELCKLFIKEKKYSNASYLLYRLDPKNPESYLIKSSALEKIDFHQSVQIILNFAFVDLAKYSKNIPYQEIIYSVLYARNRLFELLFKYFDHTFKIFSKTGIQTQTDLDKLYNPLFNEIAKKMNTLPEFGHKYAIPRIIFLLYSFRYLLEEITIFNSNPKIDYQLITDSKFLSKINELRCETEKNLCEIDLVLLYNNDPVKGINGRYKYTNDRKIYDRLKDLFYVHNYYPASLLLCQLYFEISRYNEMENSISKNKNSKINDSIIEINDEFINDIIEEKDRLLISQGKSNEFFLFAVNDDIYQFKKEAKIKVENDEEDKNAEDNETYSSLFKKSLIDKDIKFAKIFNNSDNDEKPTTEKDK